MVEKRMEKYFGEPSYIAVDSIRLVEVVHIKGNPNYQYKHKPSKDCVVVVRRTNHGYDLVSGWADYQECLHEGYKMVRAFITDTSRGEFFRKYSHTYLPLNEIIIPNHMKNTTPHEWKIKRVRNRLGEKNRLDRPITINSNHVLLDGYTRYLVAKEVGMKYVPIIWCNT